MYTDNEEENEFLELENDELEQEKTFSQYLEDELHGRNEPLVDVDELGPSMKVVYYFFLFQFFLFCGFPSPPPKNSIYFTFWIARNSFLIVSLFIDLK